MSSPAPFEDIDDIQLPDVLPVLPLQDTVIFPFVIVPLSVGSERGLLAVDRALAGNRFVMLSPQIDSTTEEPNPSQLYPVGTAGSIMRMLKLPDGRIRILVQGLTRARLDQTSQTEPFLKARIERLPETPAPPTSLELEALIRHVKDNLERALQLGKGISPEVVVLAANLDDPGRLADLVASNLDLKQSQAASVLSELDAVHRLAKVHEYLEREVQLLTMQHEISSQARGEIDRSQREYFLRQQIKTIQQELGEADEFAQDIASYRQLARDRGLSEEAIEELEKQIRRLERSQPDSAESSVIRTYLDWLTGLPWSKASKDRLDLGRAQRVLEEDHYGLSKIKERILEILAVRQLKTDARGPILCLVGPPGVGKTSLGRSIARALGRRFTRLSLGGVRDEAEIRGHRRTYVGALPGRIIQGMHQAGTSNPVFMLDEIDKIGADYRGDPSAALLEVLDPEQNHAFRDHYLGISYNLSKVLFITTANLLDPIQPAFLDRMEVLRLAGYTEEEKLEIARRHLIPKQLDENGISGKYLRFTRAGIQKIIRGHTREAGLRGLEREISALCRKVAVRVARGEDKVVVIGAKNLQAYLGPEKHFVEQLLPKDRIGIATGLAWTATGGDLLLIEVIAVPGKGKLQLTGQLGDVMKESAQTALSYARTFAERFGFSTSFFSERDLHIHAPAGSIPKDGPSAGITIATAIISALTEIPVDRQVAMTGEITLRGDILPVGGLKEKALAAHAAGVQTVLMPHLNQRDLTEIPKTVQQSISLRFVEQMDQVLAQALTRPISSEGSTTSIQ